MKRSSFNDARLSRVTVVDAGGLRGRDATLTPCGGRGRQRGSQSPENPRGLSLPSSVHAILGRVSASNVIAAVALAISCGSAVAAGVSLFLAFRESSRRDEEIRFLREEAGRRDEELSLIREQVTRAREERELEKRARLTITPGARGSSSNGISFTLNVTNAGPHFAGNVLLRLRGEDGRVAGEAWHREPVLPGSPSVEIVVETPPPDRYFGPYKVEPSWDDGRGRIVGTATVTVTRP
jgi:hypothetical protein